MISRSTARLIAAACLALLAVGCGGGISTAPGASGTRSPVAGTATALASTPAVTDPGYHVGYDGTSCDEPGHQGPGWPGIVAPVSCQQLTAAFTGLNAAMGGQRGMTLILTNHSGTTCHVYGYLGLAFFNAGGFPMATHLTWMKDPHATVVLRPGGSAQARPARNGASPRCPPRLRRHPQCQYPHRADRPGRQHRERHPVADGT